jgi:hypothetical protein
MNENEGKMNKGQDFSMNSQDLRVNMDHPMTQRMKSQQNTGNPKEKKKANTKRGRSPVWSPILLSDKSVSADTN